MVHSAKVLKMISTLEAPPQSPMPKDLRDRFIAEAAYYKAEKRGFAPGFQEQDWAEAEAEIDALFGPEWSSNQFAP